VKQSFSSRVVNWYRRNAAVPVFRRPITVDLSVPLISFTFDDFPQSALHVGGAILKGFRLFGTYYVSLGLLDTDAPAGRLCTRDDVAATLREGHELGCHTYFHCHSWNTGSEEYERALTLNQAALSKLAPGASFRSFSYPIALPRPSVKRVCGKYFTSCRGGGQVANLGNADLNQLSAFFLEKVNGGFQPIRDIIEQNNRAKGWLIFATHDVSPDPSPYGCTPGFFQDVVQCAVDSGATILPIARAVDVIRGSHSDGIPNGIDSRTPTL
jgi:hypothetical protein